MNCTEAPILSFSNAEGGNKTWEFRGTQGRQCATDPPYLRILGQGRITQFPEIRGRQESSLQSLNAS